MEDNEKAKKNRMDYPFDFLYEHGLVVRLFVPELKQARHWHLITVRLIYVDGRTLVIWNASSDNVIPEGVCPAEFSVSSLVERCTDIKEAFPKKISIFFNWLSNYCAGVYGISSPHQP